MGHSSNAAINAIPGVLASMGHDVSMLALAGGDASELANAGVKVIEVSGGWFGGVKRSVSSLNPDIIHVFIHAGCGLYPLMFKRHVRSRFVLDIRSPLLRSGLARIMHRIKNSFEPIGYDAIASHGIESAWTQLGRRSDIHLLPPGVDLSSIPQFASSSRQEGDGRLFRMVYTGSLDWLRQPERLIEAAIQASKKEKIQLDIYGDGEAREQLEQTVVSHGMAERIRFMGVLDRKILFSKLGGYDAGVAYVPGGMYDSAPPLKTLEYLACGLPVLATDTHGNRMFVQDGINGMLASGEPEAFASAIVRMVKSKNLEAMHLHARSSVEEFDWKRIVSERLLPLYESLLAEHHP